MPRIIDLTLTLRPSLRGVAWETARTVERDGWNARTLHLYSHAGTHMDAQTHFAAGPETIDQIPLDRCMGPATMIDLTGVEPKGWLGVDLLGPAATEFRAGECLLLRTGWSGQIEDSKYYRDNFPRIAEDLALWCVEHRVKILGVEPPSVADVNNLQELTRIHHILLGGGVTIVEGLANLDQIGANRFFFGALPLKIEGGDGSPCRAFAITGAALT